MADDLYVSYFLEDNPDLPNFFSFGFDTPQQVSGLTKLLGVFLKELFTSRGSDIYDLNAGTVLPNLIGGNVASIAEAQDVVFLALDQAEQNVLRYQANFEIPQAERLGTVAFLSIAETEAGDGVSARFQLQNAAGQSLIAELPVT